MRAAGIHSDEQTANVKRTQSASQIAVADALTAHARMLERPAFIEWLPTVTERSYETGLYAAWLQTTRDLHARIRASLDAKGRTSQGLASP